MPYPKLLFFLYRNIIADFIALLLRAAKELLAIILTKRKQPKVGYQSIIYILKYKAKKILILNRPKHIRGIK